MSRAVRFGGRLVSQAGFTLAEMLVVLSVIGIVVGLSIPSLSRSIDTTKLKGATQSLAGAYQDARLRATQNNQPYEIIVSPAGVSPAQVCIDLDGDGQCGANDPATQFASQVTLNNNVVPTKLTQALLGFDPSNTEKSQMRDEQNDLAPGLAWSGLGVPCERISSTARCTAIGWVQYLEFQRGTGEVLFAAVTVSPTGRVKIWTYIPSGNGNGNWL